MQPEGSTRFLSSDAELFVTENDHTHSIYHKSQPTSDRTQRANRTRNTLKQKHNLYLYQPNLNLGQ